MTYIKQTAGLLMSARIWGVRGLMRALLVTLSTLAGVGFTGGATSLAQGAPVPIASFNQTLIPPDVPSEVLIGETFTFKVRFKNTGTIGFGPFIDLVLDSGGADLNTSSGPCDGITFVSAKMVAVNPPLALTSFPVGPAAPCPGGPTSPLAHPYGGTPFGPVTVPPGAQLVTIKLPFGSFDPSQPEIVVEVTAKVHNFADVNQPLKICERGGFQFGATATSGSPILEPGTTTNVSTWKCEEVKPTVFKIKKEYLGPEDEAVSGPNFVNYYPLKYKITVDIADGQAIHKLRVIDNLPNQLQYYGNLKVWIHTILANQVPAVGGCPANPPLNYQLNSVPSLTVPDGQLEVQLCNPIIGTTAPDDVVIEFEFYIPNNVLDADCDPSPVLVKNDVKASGLWDPLDPRDPNPGDPPGTLVLVTSDEPGPEHILKAKCLAIQKSVKVHQEFPGGAAGPTPGDILKYTLKFQISDYHTIGKLKITDILADGQEFNFVGSPLSTFTVTDQFGTESGNFTLNNDLTATPDANAAANFCPPPLKTPKGGTILKFDVSAAMINNPPGLSRPGIMTGGHAAGLPLSPVPATGTIVFYAKIRDSFAFPVAPGDKFVDKHDPINNCVTIQGKVYKNVDKPAIPIAIIGSAKDDSKTQISIVTDILKKSVYAVKRGNMFVCASGALQTAYCAPGVTPDVRPSDQVTFRIEYSIPSGDAEFLTIRDWLPLPIFNVTGMAFTAAPCPSAAIPLPGSAGCGPNHTAPVNILSVTLFPTPAFSIQPGNSILFDYGTIYDTLNAPKKIDLLFTLTVTNKPFADGLFLTNEAQECEKNTFGVTFCQVAVAQVKVREPKLGIRKGVIATNNNPNGVITPSITSGTPVGTPPGATCPQRFTPIINSGNLNGFIPPAPVLSQLNNVDAGDWVTFAIAIENTGGAPAYEIELEDIIPLDTAGEPACFKPNFSGLCVRRGSGPPIPFTITPMVSGKVIIKLGAPLGPITDPPGTNIAIITFNAQLLDKAKLKSGCCENKAQLTYYGSTPPTPTVPINGSVPPPNFVDAGFGGPFVDTAKVCVGPRADKKCIQTTSELHTTPQQALQGGQVPAAIGEIVRYRLITVIPEGTTQNFQIKDLLPLGLTYVGNPSVVFVTNSGPVTSPPANWPTINGDETTHGRCPGPPIPTNALNVAVVPFTFGTGKDPIFFVQSPTNPTPIFNIHNPDTDTNLELAIIEFNAQVDNILTNQASTNLPDRFVVRYQDAHTNQPVTSPPSGPVTVHIVEPNLTITKSVLPTTVVQGGTVTYTVNITNNGTATAFDVRFTDTLPAGLTLVPGSVTANCSGAVIGTGISVTCPQVPVAPALGSTVTITYQATVSPTVPCNTTLTNKATVTWTSLPGPQGTPPSPGNPTGQQTVGPSGAATPPNNVVNGERNGSSAYPPNPPNSPNPPNDYFATASVAVTVICPVSEICGIKFNDLDGDGVRDLSPLDPGVPGWTINITPPGSPPSVTTGANGNYCFTVPTPGTYTVSEAQVPGWTPTTPPTQTVTVPPGVGNLNFGNQKHAVSDICGIKFNDLDGDGVKDPGEPGLPGWTINITPPGSPPSVTTGANGNYCFTVPTPGTYTVSEVPQSGWTPTTPPTQTKTVPPGVGNVNFGNQQKDGKCDLKIEKFTDPAQPVLGQPFTLVVRVTNVGGAPCPPTTTVTDTLTLPLGVTVTGNPNTTGGWVCTLPPNVTCTNTTLTLQPTQSSMVFALPMLTTAAGYAITFENCATVRNPNDRSPPNNPANNTACVTVQPKTVPPGKAEICVKKFHDKDGDGVQDPGEPGLPGWTINIKNAGGNVVATLTTGPQGTLCTGVPAPATYTVSEVLQAGWTPTAPPTGTQTVTVTPSKLVNLSFGNKQKKGDDKKCDLAIKKEVTPNPATSGQAVTIALSVTNVGTGPCGPDTVVQDPRPAGLTFTAVPVANKPGWTCNLPGGNASCVAAGTLSPGYTATFTFTTAPVTAPPAGGTIKNCATVKNPADTNTTNNQSCETVQVKRVIGPSPLEPKGLTPPPRPLEPKGLDRR
jgi:uncharacterized repeat protein (TIGR01451 family)